MEDLYRTIKKRYARGHGFHNLFTLIYQNKPKPRQQSILKASNIFSEHLYRGLLQDLSRNLVRQSDIWNTQFTRSEQRLSTVTRRIQQNMDLLLEDTQKQLRYLRKQTELIKQREFARQWDMDHVKKEDTPLTYRNAKRLIDERLAQISANLELELNKRDKKNTAEILRRLREDAYYENRRGE